MIGVDVGEPISSSGLATNDEPLERERRRPVPTPALSERRSA